jgi:hypothetical protein
MLRYENFSVKGEVWGSGPVAIAEAWLERKLGRSVEVVTNRKGAMHDNMNCSQREDEGTKT